MIISPEQFQQFAPAAQPATVAALFATDWRGASLLNRITARHDFTDAAIAQFLACASIASEGFTNFNKPFFGIHCGSWLVRAARLWRDYGLDTDANDWNWQDIVSCASVLLDAPEVGWLAVNDTLAAVCAALGIEDRSEQFADGYDIQ